MWLERKKELLADYLRGGLRQSARAGERVKMRSYVPFLVGMSCLHGLLIAAITKGEACSLSPLLTAITC